MTPATPISSIMCGHYSGPLIKTGSWFCVCVRLWALLLDQDVCAYVAVQMMHEKKREKMESHF